MLQSERLSLRPYTEKDTALLLQLYTDWHWDNVEEAFLHQFFKENIAKQYELGGGVLATFLQEGKVYIGHCGLKFMDNKDEWYLSFRFIKTFWRNQYPEEAIKVCLKWGFHRLNLQEIVVDLEEKNAGAAKMLLKVGFKLRYAFEENGEKLLRYSVFS